PHDQPMTGPSQPAAAPDEPVRSKPAEKASGKLNEVAAEIRGIQKQLPAAAPVHARRRSLQPHVISIRNAEGSEECGERVSDKRCIEVVKIARADYDQSCKKGRCC